ncbi:hypothetical protein HYH02_007239 [Chlamydomonas schloesseri]|uniref:ATP-dependent RNA helicase n=1 Tax=Chlamydomonas schloesseri TaxID=2026947 RepID=A0A835WI35_9CHLO|nr:hypothetical protein HYH02_007239 [Chlamydomonas schloesseri]|eukprot:KAG2447782.1 hypothetical protein HYH02_007239 [Chlamydomonas schloesseri]
MLLVGGTDPAQDVAAFKARGGHVMVGTPGRIEDVLKRCAAVDLRRLEVLVLDEADRLLDMGFKAQLDAVMARLPKQRRTGLFSATQTEAVQELARAGLRNPVRVNVAVAVQQQQQPAKEKGNEKAAAAAAGKEKRKEKEEGKEGKEQQQQQQQAEAAAAAGAEVEAAAAAEAAAGGSQKTPNSLSIQYVLCEPDEKIPQLVRFLRLHGPSRKVIVYAMTCAGVDHLAAVLPRLPQLATSGVRLRALHGRMKQAAREATLEAFRALPAGVLLCTDLAARGLDIPDVHWIVQLDPPQDPAAFVHRVGRTARMGRSGSALVYLAKAEEPYVEFLRLRKVPLTEGSPLPPTEGQQAAATAVADDDAAPSTSGRDAVANGAAGGGKKKAGKAAPAAATATAAAAGGGSGGGPGGAVLSAAVSTATAEVLAALRGAAERDRDVMEKATKAFVTYVRGYKEHHCKFIFRLQDLHIGRLATGLGLLRLPKMPDLKKPLGASEFRPSPVDPSTVPYRDKAREKQRQKGLQQKQHEAARSGAAASAEERAAAKRKAAAAVAAEAAEARLPAAKRRQLQMKDETAALNQEYSLLKKLKKGKISQHQYNVATGLSDDSDLEGEEPEGSAKPAGAAAAGPAGRAEVRGSDSDGDDGADSSGSDDEGEGKAGGKGSAAGAGGKPGAGGRRGKGGKSGPGTKGGKGGPLGVKQHRGALQSYIDKKARKKKRQNAKKAQRQQQ